MKEIAHSHNYPISLPVVLSQPNLTNAPIIPLQPQSEKILSAWEHLLAQVQHINQMASELEAKILELKNITSKLNSQKDYLPENARTSNKNICQYSTVSVPWVRQKSDESFILTTRKIDLFRAEREAALLAHQLRQQTHRKKLASQRQRKNVGSVGSVGSIKPAT